MGIIKIWNYLNGYVIIKIEGLTLERFLNLAATKDIYLWDIKRIDYTLLEMKVSIEGFRELRDIVKKIGCHIEIVEKKGLPFTFYKFKHRKMLGIGIFVFLIFFMYLSSIIWDIQILGNESASTEDILLVLEEKDIKTGIIKYKIDKDYIEEILLKEFDYFSYVSVETKGTKLIMEIKEQDLPPEQIDSSIPCNIIAKRKGVILKTVVRNGNTLIRKGDVVEAGDILVTGVIEREDIVEEDLEQDKYVLVHADGEILAQTRYSIKIEEPIIKIIKEETGRSVEFKEVKIGKKGFQFLKEEIPYENYEEEIEEIQLFNKINLPFKILVHKYKEIEKVEVKQNIDFLKKSTHIRGVEELNKEIPKEANIQSKDVKYYMEEGMLSTYITIEVVEDIGEKQIINYTREE